MDLTRRVTRHFEDHFFKGRKARPAWSNSNFDAFCAILLKGGYRAPLSCMTGDSRRLPHTALEVESPAPQPPNTKSVYSNVRTSQPHNPLTFDQKVSRLLATGAPRPAQTPHLSRQLHAPTPATPLALRSTVRRTPSAETSSPDHVPGLWNSGVSLPGANLRVQSPIQGVCMSWTL